MASILFLISDHIGHVHSALRMANRLRARGHSVVFLGSGTAGAVLERQGTRFRTARFLKPLPAPGRLFHDLSERLRQRRTVAEERRESIREMRFEVNCLVRDLAPNLLIFDPFVLAYSMAFHSHRIPSAVLSANVLLDPDPLVPPYTSAAIPSDSCGSRVRVAAAWGGAFATYTAFRAHCLAQCLITGTSSFQVVSDIAAAFSYPLDRDRIHRPVSFDFCLRSVPEIVLWTPRFDFPRAMPLRPGVRYGGPSVELDRREDTIDWSTVPGRAALVYCSLGTVELPDQIPARREFLRKAIRAFELLPDCTLLLASGTAVSRELFGPLPRNVACIPVAPQIGVLRRADLFITHGGANSIKESILLNVPLLVYPRRADQPGNAARVVSHGLGMRGAPAGETPEGIAGKVREVLEDSRYRRNIARMREDFLDYDSREVDAERVEELLVPVTSDLEALSRSGGLAHLV